MPNFLCRGCAREIFDFAPRGSIQPLCLECRAGDEEAHLAASGGRPLQRFEEIASDFARACRGDVPLAEIALRVFPLLVRRRLDRTGAGAGL